MKIARGGNVFSAKKVVLSQSYIKRLNIHPDTDWLHVIDKSVCLSAIFLRDLCFAIEIGKKIRASCFRERKKRKKVRKQDRNNDRKRERRIYCEIINKIELIS